MPEQQKEDFEYTEFERIAKVQNVFHEYGIENFAISYSGGKDSNVLSELVDLAVPGNRVPRVYVNTGIELKAVSDFVKAKAKADTRIHIIEPQKNVRETLETYGYPFKSKEHSNTVYSYYNYGMTDSIRGYVERTGSKYNEKRGCPYNLRYQFTPENKLLISDKCCYEMKEKPLTDWKRRMNKKYDMIGVRRAEGGRRHSAQCLVFKGANLRAFQPLAPVSDEWEDWFIAKHDVKLPEVYYPPYSFDRTGCKGCPFNIELQTELDILKEKMPEEWRQCERIWKPVYSEYRRLGYRLRKEDYQDADSD